jgi:hypothetical protein
MGLINSTVFMGTLQSYRLCWISGRFGGGKTSFAYKVAEDFLKRGYRLITNNESVWADDLSKVDLLDNGMLHAVILLDEGGLWFKSSKQIEMIASYAAKMDCVYIIPSFWPPTRAAQVLTVQPIFNLKGTGIPIVVYKWKVKLGGFMDSGTFLWSNPGEIFGVYSRQDPGDTGADIVEYLIEKTEAYRNRFGRGRKTFDGLPGLETEVSSTDLLLEASENMAQAVDTWTSIPVRKSNKRGF